MLYFVFLLLILSASGLEASVITTVSTLDGTTGLPIPGSGDMDFGMTLASSSSAGSAGLSTYAGKASAGHLNFVANGFQHNSFQFKLFSEAVNPLGIGGGPEAFEVGAEALWDDKITGTLGDIVLLPEDLRLVFNINFDMPIVDPHAGSGGTVAVDFSVNSSYGPNPTEVSNISAYGTNVDGGLTDIAHSLMNARLLYIGVVGTQTYSTYSLPVKRGIPFQINFRSLSVLGTDGSATGRIDNTISLVGVTNELGTESYNNVLFDSGPQFSFSAVPEPSSLILLSLGCLGGLSLLGVRSPTSQSLGVPTGTVGCRRHKMFYRSLSKFN